MNSLRIYRKKTILGSKIILRRLKREDLKKSIAWLKDTEINKFLNSSLKDITRKQEIEWFNYINKSENDLVFAIIVKENGKFIGNCGLLKINFGDKSCEFGIFIGEKDYWGKGFGTDAIKTLIKFATEELKLNILRLNVYEYNYRAIKVYKKCGFVISCICDEKHFYNGKYWNTYLMEYKKQ